jgi:magnesium chelatase family protein
LLAKTESVAIVGTEALLVEIEVDVANGIPAFAIVGLPAKSVMEAEQRVRSALEASDGRWPPHRMIANMAPGALRKEGTHFDVALALGLVAGDERLPAEALKGWVVVGEVGLDGSVRPIRGTLAAALACRDHGRRGLICPAANAAEAAIVEGIEVVPVSNLKECFAFMKGDWLPGPIEATGSPPPGSSDDMADVRGQERPKEAVEIAAAGGHNLLMSGSPGAGKTMLARRLPGILPRMSPEESLEVTRVYSVAGLLGVGSSLISMRPFRLPHHHVSMAGLIGGGVGLARPGEVSLAHASIAICY